MDEYVQMREDAKERMLSSNEKCRISEDAESFFLLEPAGVTDDMESRILSSCNNSYDDKKKVLDALYFHTSQLRLKEKSMRQSTWRRRGSATRQ